MNTHTKDMPFGIPWTREDKVFATTLVIVTTAILSLMIKYAPTQNMGSMAYIYLEISIMVGIFTAIMAMETDKKIHEDKYLKAEILYTAITIVMVMAVAAAGFAAGFIAITIRPILLFPTILVVTYIIMFRFVPKMNDISAFFVRRIAGHNAPH